MAIQVMRKLGLETTDLRVALITTTGRITTDVFVWDVAIGLLKTLWQQLLDMLSGKAAPWLFQGLLIVLTFIAFRALARIIRYLVRRAVRSANASRSAPFCATESRGKRSPIRPPPLLPELGQ